MHEVLTGKGKRSQTLTQMGDNTTAFLNKKKKKKLSVACIRVADVNAVRLKAISIPRISDGNIPNTITVTPRFPAYYNTTLYNKTQTGNITNENKRTAASASSSAEIFIRSGSIRITNLGAPCPE